MAAQGQSLSLAHLRPTDDVETQRERIALGIAIARLRDDRSCTETIALAKRDVAKFTAILEAEQVSA